MGYRSEVGILVTLPNNVSGNEIIAKFKNAFGKYFDECFEIDNEESIKGLVYIHTKICLKWYEGCEGYEDVTNTMRLIRSWEDDYKDGGISYLRIGEDLEDTEEEYYGEPERYLCCERSISW